MFFFISVLSLFHIFFAGVFPSPELMFPFIESGGRLPSPTAPAVSPVVGRGLTAAVLPSMLFSQYSSVFSPTKREAVLRTCIKASSFSSFLCLDILHALSS